jgi:hypothetical protein
LPAAVRACQCGGHDVSRAVAGFQEAHRTLTFAAVPAGTPGTLVVKARKQGKRRVFVVARAAFTAAGPTRVKVKAPKAAYRALGKRRGKRARADVTFILAGQRFVAPVQVRR